MPEVDRSLPSLGRYQAHLEAAADWLVQSERPTGGSAAYFSPLRGWSRAYPETTGYSIPTLLAMAGRVPAPVEATALRFGEWLLKIQNADGSWNAGLHPGASRGTGSVFNTGQVLKGMVALWKHSHDSRWLDAATCGAEWLRAGMGPSGLWDRMDYRSDRTPSYYTHVLWPMLEVATIRDDPKLRDAARQGLNAIVARRRSNGVIAGWAFEPGAPAFTHTIAYTLRGIQESARLLAAHDEYDDVVMAALDVLSRRSELAGGRLPGAFDDDWRPVGRYICLTGSAQVAICLLIAEARRPDLRLVSAAARLIDVVCKSQWRCKWVPGLDGAVGGSSPLWGPYMRLRFPNWAAKYFCDALMRLDGRVRDELR